MSEPAAVPLADLQPSQLFLSDEKLATVLGRLDLADSEYEPIPVAEIDGDLVILDDHHRAFVLHLAGADDVRVVRASDDLDLQPYRTCVGWCRDAGIESIDDLAGCVLSHETFEEEWIERCHDAFD